MSAYYNENDPKTAAWLRELIKENLIAPGEVDERSITEVKGSDVKGFSQCHFFAGIGGWSYALRLAGWPDYEPVWTGSCPCQPFSQAGKGKVDKDERHLWPTFRDLIAECGPPVCFGEQVCSPDGRIWLAGVRTDLEALGYVLGAVDTCAAGCGSPQTRQRLYWVANSPGSRCKKPIQQFRNGEEEKVVGKTNGTGSNGSLGISRVGNPNDAGSQGWGERLIECSHQWPVGTPNLAVLCTDGKARRFKPGAFPLADGFSGRVGLLRGYGNAIVPQVAAEFIRAYVDLK